MVNCSVFTVTTAFAGRGQNSGAAPLWSPQNAWNRGRAAYLHWLNERKVHLSMMRWYFAFAPPAVMELEQHATGFNLFLRDNAPASV
jgi:hypothetical protein